MDVDAGKYERKGRRGGKKKRQSMVDVFLGDRESIHERISMATTKKRGQYRFGGGPSCWDRFMDLIRIMAKILCSCPVLIFISILGAGLIVIPAIMKYQESSSAAIAAAAATTKPTPPVPVTPAPVPITPAPTTTPAPVEAPSSNTQQQEQPEDNIATPLFSEDEVKQRVAELEDYMTKSGVSLDLTVPSMVQAISWVAAYDPAMMVLTQGTTTAMQNQVVQRVAMAALYYATHPQASAETTNVSPQISKRRQLQVQGQVRRRRHLPSQEWINEHSVCQWQGVGCQNDAIVHLNLTMQQLQGTLPESLILCTELMVLDLSHNQIQGTLPASWTTSFPRLEHIWLQDNQLNGELPASISDWGDTVKDLRLNNNALTGTVPPEIESFHRLVYLSLANNSMDGHIPDVFDRWHSLGECFSLNGTFAKNPLHFACHFFSLSVFCTAL